MEQTGKSTIWLLYALIGMFLSVVGQETGTGIGFVSFPVLSNVTFVNGTLAPLFNNISVNASAAWVYPDNRFDIGARQMNCECFNPSS
jgi:uncharacterized membrane protein YfcA